MAQPQTKEPQPQPGNQGVQLGFGTLIIIALIVTMCSGRSEMEKIQKDTAELKRQLGAIDRKLERLAPQGSATITPASIGEPAPRAAGVAQDPDSDEGAENR